MLTLEITAPLNVFGDRLVEVDTIMILNSLSSFCEELILFSIGDMLSSSCIDLFSEKYYRTDPNNLYSPILCEYNCVMSRWESH